MVIKEVTLKFWDCSCKMYNITLGQKCLRWVACSFMRRYRPLSLKSWYFEASKDIKTKFKPQALHVIVIKYWKVGGSCNPRIPTLWNKGILLHEQTTHNKHFWPKCTCSCCCKTLEDVRRATLLTPVLLLWIGVTEFY